MKINTLQLTNAVQTANNFLAKGEFNLSDKITLSNIEGKITVSSTDFIETIAINNIDCQPDNLTDSTNFEPFSVDGKMFLSVLKSIKTSELEMQIDTETNKLSIKAGRRKAILEFINDTHNFLITNNMGKPVSIDKLDDINKVLHAVGVNNPRHEVTGVHLNSNNGILNVVSTDTRRLSVVTKKTEDKDFSCIIPKSGVINMLKLFGGLNIDAYIQETYVVVTTNDISYSCKLINGNYPEYQRIIPQSTQQTFTLDRTKFIELIKEASIFEDTIEISIRNNEIVIKDLEGSSETSESLETNNANILFRVSAKYILEFLVSYSDEKIQIGFNDKNLPIMLIADSEYKEVLMPVVINENEEKQAA